MRQAGRHARGQRGEHLAAFDLAGTAATAGSTQRDCQARLLSKGYLCMQCRRLEEMPEDSAEDNLAAFDPALAEAARALRQHGFLQTTASAGGSDAPTLALSSSTGNLQARPSTLPYPEPGWRFNGRHGRVGVVQNMGGLSMVTLLSPVGKLRLTARITL